ncbi:unnamed protein product [Caretta caretta]
MAAREEGKGVSARALRHHSAPGEGEGEASVRPLRCAARARVWGTQGAARSFLAQRLCMMAAGTEARAGGAGGR